MSSSGTAEFLRRGARGRGHVAVDRDDLVAARGPDEDRALPAERIHLRIDQALDEAGCDRGIDRVAARLERVDAGIH
jgi:hypothetical protein